MPWSHSAARSYSSRNVVEVVAARARARSSHSRLCLLVSCRILEQRQHDTDHTPSQHGLEMRKYYAEQWKKTSTDISRMPGATSTCGIFFFRQTQVELGVHMTSSIDEVTPPDGNSGSSSYVVSGADTAGDFGA